MQQEASQGEAAWQKPQKEVAGDDTGTGVFWVHWKHLSVMPVNLKDRQSSETLSFSVQVFRELSWPQQFPNTPWQHFQVEFTARFSTFRPDAPCFSNYLKYGKSTSYKSSKAGLKEGRLNTRKVTSQQEEKKSNFCLKHTRHKGQIKKGNHKMLAQFLF